MTWTYIAARYVVTPVVRSSTNIGICFCDAVFKIADFCTTLYRERIVSKSHGMIHVTLKAQSSQHGGSRWPRACLGARYLHDDAVQLAYIKDVTTQGCLKYTNSCMRCTYISGKTWSMKMSRCVNYIILSSLIVINKFSPLCQITAGGQVGGNFLTWIQGLYSLSGKTSYR